MLVFENINELIYLYNNEKTIDIERKLTLFFHSVLMKELKKRIHEKSKYVDHNMIDESYEKLYLVFLKHVAEYDSRIHHEFINYCLKGLISTCKNETKKEYDFNKKFTQSIDSIWQNWFNGKPNTFFSKNPKTVENEEDKVKTKLNFVEQYINIYANDFNKRVYQYRKNNISIEEIAKIEKVSRSALCKRWYYFMKKMRKYVEEQKYKIEF